MCIIEWIFLPAKNLPPFCVVVFSNLFSKKIDDTSRLLDEMKWNPRTVNSYPFICHSADNSSYTSCLLLFCALVSSDFFIWSSWSFSKFSTPLFLTLYRCWWRELRFRWIKWSVIMNWFKIYSFRCVLVLTERKMHI